MFNFKIMINLFTYFVKQNLILPKNYSINLAMNGCSYKDL